MPNARVLTILSAILTVPAILHAAPSRNVRATLVTEAASIQPGQPFQVGLRLEMAPEWHTYWKNPGDSGLATRIRWTLPEGWSAGPLQWPIPQRIAAGPLMSFGYEHAVFLLTEMTPPRGVASGTTVRIAARADWLECKEACLPGRADLE
ncbi:MAG: protein-disulfide reductase DsbD domain-containing protein, partial [bacterium]